MKLEMKRLHPNAQTIFAIQGILGSLFGGGFLMLFFLGPLIALTIEGSPFAILLIIPVLVIIPLLIILSVIWAKYSYKNFLYRLDPDRLVIERGVIWKRYISIPYERIQNIDILRGPLARVLNVSDLQVQTAGISGVAVMEGRIPAIDPAEAEKLRDQMLDQIGKAKNQGL